jgi:hypothetical protein
MFAKHLPIKAPYRPNTDQAVAEKYSLSHVNIAQRQLADVRGNAHFIRACEYAFAHNAGDAGVAKVRCV